MALYAPSRNDILVRSSENQFVGIVEAVNERTLSRERAIEVRHDGMIYSLLPQTLYFLLLAEDRGFLWKDAWSKGPETPPTYEFPMDNMVAHYSGGKPLYRDSLKRLVLRWLDDLANGKRSTNEEPELTLVRAGFYEAIQEGSVTIGTSEEEV